MNEDVEKNPEIEPGGESASAFETPPAAPQRAKEPQESRFGRFMRSVLKWLVVIGAAFLAGILFVYFAIFRPAMGRLNAEIDRWSTQSQQMEAEIADLQSRIEALEPMEAENEQLIQENEQLELHIQVMSAITDITSANLALERENPADARLSLNDTSENLVEIKEQLDPSMQQVVEDMETRLENALEILERDPAAAMSDFSILTANLRKLENDLFLQP